MTILCFHSYSGLDGSTMNLGFITKSLIRGGHSVFIVSRVKDAGSLFLKSLGANLIYVKFPLRMNTTIINESQHFNVFENIILFVKDILRFIIGLIITFYCIRKLQPNCIFLVDCTFPQCAIMGFIMKIPVVSEIQAELVKGYIGLRRRLLISIINKSRIIFGITKHHLEPFIERGLNAPDKYYVISNTVIDDAKSVSDDSINQWVLEKDKVISFFGGASQIKGYKLFLEVARKILSKRNDVIFVCAGVINKTFESKYCRGTASDRYYETKYMFEFINKYDLEDYIKIIGEIDNAIMLMKRSEIVLVTNKLPHFSRPIIEAFYCKTPVIATDDRFNREIISDGLNGYLAGEGNLEEWCIRINDLIDNETIQKSLGEEGFKTFNERFDPHIIEEQVVNIFGTISSGIERQ